MAERLTWVIVTALFVFGYTAIAAADGSPTAAREIARGHALLAAARPEPAGEGREDLLSEAVEAFKSAYRWFGRDTQVRALLGAAQSYLMMQTPRRVFPFLWQATPLQRAERSAQQALVMQPDSPAAAFLLALIYWRRAQTAEDPSEAMALSGEYAAKAADLGMPVGVPGSADVWPHPFQMGDTFLVLRYGDARGTGESDDLLFIYQKGENRYVGAVVTMSKAYPLVAGAATGMLVSDSVFEGVSVETQPQGTRRIVVRARQNGRQTATSFVWKGDGFVSSD
jgi:hypothetical protein